jgi:hypothetical protein
MCPLASDRNHRHALRLLEDKKRDLQTQNCREEEMDHQVLRWHQVQRGTSKTKNEFYKFT